MHAYVRATTLGGRPTIDRSMMVLVICARRRRHTKKPPLHALTHSDVRTDRPSGACKWNLRRPASARPGPARLLFNFSCVRFACMLSPLWWSVRRLSVIVAEPTKIHDWSHYISISFLLQELSNLISYLISKVSIFWRNNYD